jgi:predicted Zn finger-like uncharacterized protein
MKAALSVLRATAVLPCRSQEPSEPRMKFVCDRCQTRYSIADEKVRQKILRIRCKTCGNVILVQESAALPEGGAEESEPHPQQKAPSSGLRVPPTASKAASGPKLHPAAGVGAASGPKLAPSASGRPASEPKLPPVVPAKAPSGPKAPPVPPNRPASGPKLQPTESHGARVVTPPPPPPAAVAADPLGGRVEWYVATGGAQSGPFSRTDAAKRILTVDPGKAVHVWKEGMSGWKPASEVSVIVAEINLLRPTPPPPPPSSSLTPPPAALPQPAHAAIHGPSVPPAHPAGPSSKTPAPAAAGKLSSFADLATLGDASAGGDEEADAFLEATTRKSQRVMDAVAAPASASFTDATTKKGKNLRDLEDQLSEPSSFPVEDEQRTPPPVRPLPPANARAVEVSRSPLGEPPTLQSPLLPPKAEPLVTFDSVKNTPRPSVPLGGFSEVVAAVAAAPRPGMSAGSVFAADGVSPSTAFLDVVPEKPRLVQLFERQPGLKYVFAAAALVVLVLLLVLVILRGDATKVPGAAKEPVKEEPAPPIEEPAKPEEPQAVAKKPTVMPVEEARSSGSRSGTRHSSVKTHLQVEKPPAPEPVSKPSSRPGHGDAPRPNPFAEGSRAVSQDQISAVVRNPANQAGLRSCYERALKMDNHLTSGRLDITVSVSASGAVDRVIVNAPANFILVEPCIKNAVRRWRFPAGAEDYGTSFPLILQGGS